MNLTGVLAGVTLMHLHIAGSTVHWAYSIYIAIKNSGKMLMKCKIIHMR